MIAIPNMEKPKACYYCWALDDSGDYPSCRITNEQRGYNFNVLEKRMDKCPLIEIVTCGECKHSFGRMCQRIKWSPYIIDLNGFCSYGERRE